MIFDGVIFTKRCPACGKWMVWNFLTADAPHEWACLLGCHHREAGQVDESRLDGNMPVHNYLAINMDMHTGEYIQTDTPTHSRLEVEIIDE